MIYKDASGNYLECNEQSIDMNDYVGEWDIPKCLVPSSR
jgi:hypothetical protein